MLNAIIILSGLTLILGLILAWASHRFKVESNPIVDEIDKILPQTQCGQCGFPGCKPYAQAIANNEADINQCPPGGDEGVHKLAELLNKEFKPLNAEHGEHKSPSVAIIDENLCIGCTLCIQACPVDAIIGSAKQMHTVVESLCTGCELCIKPCPVDCIDMIEIQESIQNWKSKYPIINITRI